MSSDLASILKNLTVVVTSVNKNHITQAKKCAENDESARKAIAALVNINVALADRLRTLEDQVKELRGTQQ